MTTSTNIIAKNRLTAAVVLATTTLLSVTGCFSNDQIENHTHTGEDIAASTNGFSYTAQGNEPDWTVKVNNNDMLTFTTAESENEINLEAERTAFAKGVEYTGNHDGKPFALVLKGEACSDTMQETTYTMTANFEFNGATYKGCADKD